MDIQIVPNVVCSCHDGGVPPKSNMTYLISWRSYTRT